MYIYIYIYLYIYILWRGQDIYMIFDVCMPHFAVMAVVIVVVCIVCCVGMADISVDITHM